MATKPPLTPDSPLYNPDSVTGRFPIRSPRPLDLIGRQTGPVLNVPQAPPPPVQVAQAAPTLPITPEVMARFRRRLIAAGDDKALAAVVRDAAKYGVDWSHMLIGLEK